MPQAIFRGAEIHGYTGIAVEGGRVIRVHMQADYTDTLRETLRKMDWKELPDTSQNMKLKGELIGCTNFILEPNGGGQSADIACVKLTKFLAVRVKDGKKKDVTKEVVRFDIIMNDESCAGVLDAYYWVNGAIGGQLKVKYAQQTKTDSHAGETPAEPDKQPALIEIPDQTKKKRNKAEVTQ